VQGESLARLIRTKREACQRVPPSVLSSIASGVLHGLHAAHEAKSEHGEPLEIVHRDVSPQNILVGADGVARVVEFGVATGAWRANTTGAGKVKGKFSYMAPEQLLSEPVDRRADLYAMGIVLWEGLTGTRLFNSEDAQAIVHRVLHARVDPPSAL